MSKRSKKDSKEMGLEVGIIVGKHLFNTEHLHYGYWTDDLDLTIQNLPIAQKQYSEFLISQIPEGAKNILDVGCGVGRFSWDMIQKGYKVDCVSPSKILTEHARARLGDQCHIFECEFEKIDTDNRYDVILFSESFQYINMKNAFENAIRLLNDNGHILICDFFKTDAPGKSALGGGHKLAGFYETISGFPLSQVKDIDITPQTAPNLDVVDGMLMNAGLPIWNMIIHYMESNYRFIAKFLKWKYKKKIAKINHKYFSHARSAKNFAIFKSYRCMLYAKVS